jgi:outer membrane protein assembly factor BamB
MKNLLLVIICLWNLPLQAQTVKPEEGHYVREIFMEPDTLFFNSHPLFIEPNGGVFLITKNDTTSFELGTPDYVDGAFVHRTSSTIYIFYGETDMLSGTSYLEAYNTNNFERLYRAQILGFNLGQPVIRDQSVYVSSIGFVGKIDLTTGEYVWKFDELYDHMTYDFNNFDAAVLIGQQVRFSSPNRIKNRTRTIVINDQTGERIE